MKGLDKMGWWWIENTGEVKSRLGKWKGGWE